MKQRPVKSSRLWLFRALSILSPVFLLAVCELLLWLFTFGYNPRFFIPVPGGDFLTGNEKFGQRFFPVALTQPPLKFRFSARKPPDTFRIFILGSSAAAGIPSPSHNFGRILQAMLEESFPRYKIEVINTGMVAINSHVARVIARKCAAFEPDLFIVYAGNNEVVGPYGAGTILRPLGRLPAIRAGIWLRTTRVGQLVTRLADFVASSKPKFTRWRGMEMFLGQNVGQDDPRLRQVYANFRENLADISESARRSGAAVVFCTVPTNLRDCPPFSSIHSSGFGDANQAKWDAAYQLGVRTQEEGKFLEAADAYRAAVEVDGSYAELRYRLAQCLLELNQGDEAREHFIAARDADALRFRADTAINRIIRETAKATGAQLTDAEAEFSRSELSPHGLPNEALFHEHCHLTFEGNYQLAAAVFRDFFSRLIPSGTGGGQPALKVPALEACVERLAYTDWDRLQAAAEILHLTSRPPFTNQLGHEARRKRQELAVTYLQRALTEDQLAAARAAYEKAITSKPDDLVLLLNYAQLLGYLKDYTASEQLWRRLVEMLPANAQLRYDLGTELVRLGRIEEAETEFRAALRLHPLYAEAHANLAIALSSDGRLDDAIAECRLAIQCWPDYATAHANLAMFLMKQGKREEATKHAEMAKELSSPPP